MMAAPAHRRRPSARQRGVTLIEALVALMVMSFGMVALVGLMSNLRHGSDIAKQRGEAMRIAQAEQARLRAFSVLQRQAGDPADAVQFVDVITADADPRSPANSNATFTVLRNVTPFIQGGTEPQAQTVSVEVRWNDRSGREESLTLDSVVSRTDPRFAGALGITPPADGIRMPDGRHPAIPVAAKDLGGRSAYRPSSTGSTVWVFNNRTGVIVGKCSIPVATAVSSLTARDVESCNNNTVGYLVSGTIRFSNTSPANPATPEATALPLSVYLNLTPSQFTIKDANSQDVLAPGGAYPISPSYECFSDAPTSTGSTQPFVNYSCIVYPNIQSPPNWWGQVLLGGLDLGTSEAQSKVCRYSADYNGNTRIDNEEHPAAYRGVSYSLARQNFLVVRGNVACPTALRPNPSAGIFIDYSTAQLQPAP